MTVDPTALRVVARGNHKDGYRGVIEIKFFTETFSFECGHLHLQTSAARDCVRRRVWRALDSEETPA